MRQQGFRSLGTTALLLLGACSSSSGPKTSLSLASSYHLRLIDGEPLPIPQGGGTIDSGQVRRLGGDTIWIAEYSHSPGSAGHPGLMTIASGTWLGSQSGNVVVLRPLLASTQDTMFVGQADTLTRHASGQVEVYVAP